MESMDAALRTPWLDRSAAPEASFFEYWPGWVFYTPVVLHWLWLGLRHGGFTLPTAANPAIETGGLCGESKSAILDQLRGPARAAVAPYTVIRREAGLEATRAAALAAMARTGLELPLVVKPDIGCNGTGVRLVRDLAGLDATLGAFPVGCDLVLQRLITAPGEAGLFYIREPGAAQGRISSVTLKQPPSVIGDGRANLRALILRDPRTAARPQFFLERLRERLEEIPGPGETVRLVFVGNHCKGSTFTDGRAQVTPELTARIEAIARALPDFHFGRFDLRFETLAALRRGEGFSIIEINGVGSEATHIWDPRGTLRDAYRTQFEHYGAAFRIGAAMRRAGARPSSPVALLRAWLRQRRLMARYPEND